MENFLCIFNLTASSTICIYNTISTEIAIINTITVELPDVQKTEGKDYFLEFDVTLKEDQIWAGDYSGHAGDTIAYEQINLAYVTTITQPAIDGDNEFNKVEETDEVLNITGNVNGNDFALSLDKTTGYISDYTFAGKTLMNEGPTPNYFRAKIDNDPADDPNLAILNSVGTLNFIPIRVKLLVIVVDGVTVLVTTTSPLP